jgi:hypothetical protein
MTSPLQQIDQEMVLVDWQGFDTHSLPKRAVKLALIVYLWAKQRNSTPIFPLKNA